MKTKIRNVGPAVSLPAPYRALLGPGQAVVVGDAPETVLARLGGARAIQGSLTLYELPDSAPTELEPTPSSRVFVLGVPATKDADVVHALYGGTETRAVLDLGTLAAGRLDTIVRAVEFGPDGNEVTVELAGDSGLGDGVTIDEVGSAVTIHFESGVSTVLDVEDAIGTDSDLLTVLTAGTAATVLSADRDEFSATLLAGGAAAVKAFLDLDTATGIDTVLRAKTAGTGGNALTIQTVGDSGLGVGVTVDESAAPAIVIHFETGVSTDADLETAVGLASLIEVKTPSAAPTHVLLVVADEAGPTNLAGGTAAVKAELDAGGEGSGDLDTVLRARTAGVAGNSITVELVGDSESGVEIEESGSAVTVHYEDNVSTVANVESAIAADSALVEVKTAGTGATVLSRADEFDPTALAGALPEASSDRAFPGPITNPDVPRNLRVTFSSDWDEGDVTVIGTDALGRPTQETFLSDAGGIRVGTKIFATVQQIVKSLASDAGGAASVGTGDLLGLPADLFDDDILLFIDGLVNAGAAVQGAGVLPSTLPNGSRKYILIANV